MFDYDSLALNVTSDFMSSVSPQKLEPQKQSVVPKSSFVEDNVLRRLSGESTDTFDCSASSGYGSSCTGTPLASPALLPTNFLAQNLQKILADCDLNEHIGIGGKNDHADFLSFLSEMTINDHQIEENANKMPPPPKQTTLFTLPSRVDCQFSYPTQRNGSVDSLPPAVQDGFTVDEVMEFSQLLCSPKKTPPSHYQCHICFNTGHYISDCPMRFNSNHDELTPYQGRKKCYGEFICTICKRRWTSQNSVANEAQSCLKCGIAVFPHKQLPVDKAIALGLVKAQRTVPTKLAPIGSGRISVRQ